MKTDSTGAETLSPTKRALLGLKTMQSKLEALEYAKTEPIAIIGMGCRFPGNSDNPQAFWQMLRGGIDAIKEVPSNRWDIEAYYHPEQDIPGKMYCRSGGFLEQIDTFDPRFFGISPHEAARMDPQQRLLLEVSWEALEYANQVPEKLYGSSTGVFVGITSFEYGSFLFGAGGYPERIDAYSGTGGTLGVAAGRLSYLMGFTGPSFIIDTACSSSLVSLHLACQSLRLQECHLALTGGVSLIISPESMINFCQAHMLAPDGYCKTFDAAANGYVRGEGCGVIVLKRLSDAVADGDNILALVRSSAVNQDGPSGGLTVPSGPAQEKVIRQALTNGKLEPNQIDYIEAHGTGTPLGDPIEIGALTNVFGGERSPEHPLQVGAVKTNIGHLDAAAGMASLIKVVLSLQHREIPPHLHFNQPSPHILWDESSIKIPIQKTPWPSINQPRRAGISGFGFSGTNAHVIVEEAPSTEIQAKSETKRPFNLLTLSAKTKEALLELAQRYEDFLSTESEQTLTDICFTANTCRTHFHHRLSVVATTPAQTQEKLATFTHQAKKIEVLTGKSKTPPKIAFLFTGQGSQYINMGRQLYDTQPIFRKTLEQCDEILCTHLEKPLLEVLYPKEKENIKTETTTAKEANNTLKKLFLNKERSSSTTPSTLLDETIYTQPALFALEYALVELWKSWGITPDIVMGHSMGEYVAACVAGVFSLEEGLELIAKRAKLVQALPKEGEMITAFTKEERVADIIQPYAQDVSIATINGVEMVVISGKQQIMQEVITTLEADRIRTVRLEISHAFHSPLIEPILSDFERIASRVQFKTPEIGLISNITGELATDEIATPAYWCQHMRQPVRFVDGMQTLHHQLGYEVFVEIGPEPTLLGLDQCLPPDVGAKADTEVQWLPSLRRGQDDWQQILQSLGALYVRGATIDWFGFNQDYPHQRVILPTYPFQRQRFWLDTSEKQPLESVNKTPVEEITITNSSSVEEIVTQDVTTNASEVKNTPFIPQESIETKESFDKEIDSSLEKIMAEQLETMSQLMAEQLDVLADNKR
jgi:acyl transferase domain-containing protein